MKRCYECIGYLLPRRCAHCGEMFCCLHYRVIKGVAFCRDGYREMHLNLIMENGA